MKSTILVVDDDKNFRHGLERLLRREGLNVVMAPDGWEAIEMVKQGSVDLALVDVKMPNMNGYQFLELMKSDPDHQHIPVIMISGLDDIDSVIMCLEAGAEDYINKPFNSTLLLTRIRGSLEKKQFHEKERQHLNTIRKEKQHAEELLRVIFPQPIVQELQTGREIKPRGHENVSVLFADVVGFTSFCHSSSPEEVLFNLQELVEAFEGIAVKHGMQKIKTIGDAFMCVGGLWDATNPAISAVECGLDMVERAPQLAAKWQVRVGVHTGPVIAGVVGHLQYLFDIWGDTVNVASRVQESGAPGTVTLSDQMLQHLQGRFNPESRGRIPLKGRGEMELFALKPGAKGLHSLN
ncbi:Uncharacterized protein SCG7086_BS_00070 [Chlamydiales bacterium SCGC AG-110-P3]|nr:Uncharacterized protein SCG7086_BS_00070 [Chlamydiales bacterium SCGC AG-110-P3]